MVEFPQSLERMTPAFGDLFEAIKRQEISHYGDPVYAQQILNAVPRLNERGFTLAKRKSRGKIDCAYALMMCFARASVKQKVRSPLVVL
jgi:phage terminase large subunit-like protein